MSKGALIDKDLVMIRAVSKGALGIEPIMTESGHLRIALCILLELNVFQPFSLKDNTLKS